MNEPSLTTANVSMAVLGGACALLAVGILVDMELGVLLLALYAFGGAVARVVMPISQAFAVRRRAVDVSVLVVFGVALTYLGLTTPLG